MMMSMKGHNGLYPCRMCTIRGLRIPEKPRVTTHYVPLHRARYPTPAERQNYNPASLPMRTHAEIIAQGRAVQMAPSEAAADRLAKESGVKGLSILSRLPSIRFPTSFPYDFMHLVFENVTKTLIRLWTGEFKDIPEGRGEYEFGYKVYDGIGAATAASGDTIPGVFGARPPNIAQDNTAPTADSWSFWLLYIGPVLLSRRFKKQVYYDHFIRFVRLVNSCMQFTMTRQELQAVREGFCEWVVDFEKYVHEPMKLYLLPDDRNKHRRNAPSIFLYLIPTTRDILVVEVRASPQLKLAQPETLILAYIHSCNPRYTNSLGMTLYDRMGVYEVVDITTVQCLVGRVPRKWPDPDFYAIVDRSSSVNRSIYVPDDD
ncbi:hypothetical protein EV715DRAFT_271829 [Schizophyllum commune]